MTLGEHFREFRRRLFIAAAAVLVASIVAGVFYDEVFAFLSEPFNEYRPRPTPRAPQPELRRGHVGALQPHQPVDLRRRDGGQPRSGSSRRGRSSCPGLTRKEKRISLAFLGSTIPLFLLGCWLGYAILPQSLAILYGFSPEGTSNIQQVSMYFSFVTRFILVFGLGFLFPVVLVALNVIGAMPATRLIRGLAGGDRAHLRLRRGGDPHGRPLHDVRLRRAARRPSTSPPGSSAACSTSARRRPAPTGWTSTTPRPRRSD